MVHPGCGLATGTEREREGDSVEGRTRPAFLRRLDDGRAAGVGVVHGGVLVVSHRAGMPGGRGVSGARWAAVTTTHRQAYLDEVASASRST